MADRLVMRSTNNSLDQPGAAGNLALYYSESCWFCARVRQVTRELGLELELRDVDREAGRRAELIAGGGKGQVPCLRIEDPSGAVRWMYESADIGEYLRGRFAA
jgi:glutathione S-transferase